MNPHPEVPGDNIPAQANPVHRILVVDDDSEVRKVSAELLIQSGYTVDAAEDGAAAWSTLQCSGYDLVVTDQNMPKVTGVELVIKLRAARMALPVILVSGAIPAEELNRHPCLQLAATLPKPFTADELLLAVKEVLRRTAGARGPMALAHNQQIQPPAADGLRL